ncbi:MAG: TetR-like C-terminal domain-containing protein [Mycobacterium sp.]
MVDDHPLADVDRERVVAAVHEEVARWGIDRFDLGSMAHRHGLDEQAILQHWPGPEALVLDALAHRPGDADEPPDTGSLRTDLFELAVRMATLVTSATGRKLHGGHLIADTHIASVDIRRTAWRDRADSLGVVFDRARERGELHGEIDFLNVLELLFAPINMRALYTGEPVDDDYCRTISELVYRAVAAG